MFRVAFSLLITRGDGRKSCGPEPPGRRFQQDALLTLMRKRILGRTGRGRLSRRLLPAAIFQSAGQFGGGERETSSRCTLWDGGVPIVLRAGPLLLPKISWNVAAAAASRQSVCDSVSTEGKRLFYSSRADR